jgi:RND family efflux transporter MFP subunit
MKPVFRNAVLIVLLVLLGFAGYRLRKSLPLDRQAAVTLVTKTKAWFLAEKTETAQAAVDPDAHAEHGKGERKVAYWYNAMNPSEKYDKPGIASDGMALVPKYKDELDAMANMPPGTVMLSPDKQQLIGVRTAQVTVADMSRTLRTVGRIETDQTKIARIHTKFQGWIDKVYIDFVGKPVSKGQPLFSIYSPELVATQHEYLLALRAQKLLSNPTFRETGGDPDALLASARQRLKLWDISDEQIERLENTGEVTRTMVLNSPADGYVMTREAYENTFVMPDKELYTIVDLSTVWVNLDIYEYEAPFVTTGYPAQMKLPYAPGKTFNGKVTYIYPDVDINTRTLKARLEFPNPNLELKPGMFADIELHIRIGQKLQVPAEAVLDSGTRKIVFMAKPNGYFEPREIQVGAKLDGRFVVEGGLAAGETIVTSGNFLIDSESRLTASGAPAHEHGGNK